MVCTITK